MTDEQREKLLRDKQLIFDTIPINKDGKFEMLHIQKIQLNRIELILSGKINYGKYPC